jgi:malate dehydrogenase (oxaloacetate-decarboxylating)(NADP+)
VFERARADPKRVVYAEGEDERVLRAAQQALDDGLARPILVGRREVVRRRIESLNLRFALDRDIPLVDPTADPRFSTYWRLYHSLMERKGVSPDQARAVVRTETTVIAALLVRAGEADAMLCGAIGQFHGHLRHVVDIIGLEPEAIAPATLSALLVPRGTFFLCDTYVVEIPTATEIAEMTLRAAAAVRHFGVEPKVALLSHSNFGSADSESAQRMRQALALLRERAPGLEVDGEMHADSALSAEIRERIFPNSRLTGSANLLIMPNLDAANIAFNTLKVLGDGLAIGPILLGMRSPVHVLTPSVTVRGLVNMTALAVYDAQVSAAGRR